jgi:LPS O-antigen subunit length determinant protein (WzzB/FepE family)
MTNHINSSETSELRIDFVELFKAIFDAKYLIILFTTFGAICSVLFALSLPNTYTSSVLLSPVNESESLSSKIGSYSALAGLAGVSLPGEPASKSTEAIERIRSFSFFQNHFLPYIKIEDLIAAEDWDHEKNQTIYDEDAFNASINKWVRKVNYPFKTIPSDQEAYKIYKKKIAIYEDKKTSFISISIEHYSPYVAKNWLDIIVKNINESMREEDKKTASNAITFLNMTSQQTNLNPIKEGIAKLVETQMQTLMLASANESYVFKVLDSPVVSEKHSGPARPIICIMITIISAMLAVIYSLARHFRKKSAFFN